MKTQCFYFALLFALKNNWHPQGIGGPALFNAEKWCTCTAVVMCDGHRKAGR